MSAPQSCAFLPMRCALSRLPAESDTSSSTPDAPKGIAVPFTATGSSGILRSSSTMVATERSETSKGTSASRNRSSCVSPFHSPAPKNPSPPKRQTSAITKKASLYGPGFPFRYRASSTFPSSSLMSFSFTHAGTSRFSQCLFVILSLLRSDFLS